MNMKRAFYIGHFQPFHLGHYSTICSIAQETDELIIGIGSAQKSHDSDNPFTAGERVMMIRNTLEDVGIKHYAIPLEDLQRNAVWVSHIKSMVPPFEIVYSNNPLVIQLFKEANIKVRQSPMFNRKEYSGTQIRRRMIQGEDWRGLVPKKVAEVIDEIEGISRIQNVSMTDYE